ncbi:MAG: flagellar assembly protein A [Candidatus Gracilibacteria bacterium]
MSIFEKVLRGSIFGAKESDTPKESDIPKKIEDSTRDRISEILNVQNGGYLYIEFDLIKQNLNLFRVNLRKFINTTFSEKGLYFNGLNWHNLEILLYGDIEDIERITDNKGNILFAESIAKKEILIRQLEFIYKGEFIYDGLPNDNKILDKQFHKPLKIKFVDLSEDDKKQMIPLFGENNLDIEYNIDQFIMYLWLNGVRFGINYDKIKEIITGKRNKDIKEELELATPENVINDEKDIVDILVNLEVTQKFKVNNDDGTVDYKRFENSFPQVKKGVTILTIKKGKKGVDGRKLSGIVINHKEEPSISVDSLVQEGKIFVDIIESLDQEGNQILTLIANKNIFVNQSKNKKLYFGEEIIHANDIGPKTGNIEVVKKGTTFHQKGSVEKPYELLGYNVSLSRNKENKETYISGTVTAVKDIAVNGSGVIIVGGKLISLYGDITAQSQNRIHGKSKLIAVNGIVEIYGDVQDTVIEADEIIVHGNSQICTLKGKKITVKGSVRNNTLIGEEIIVNKDLGENTYIMLIFYVLDKFKRQLETIRNNIVKFNKELEDLEVGIEKTENSRLKEILEKRKKGLEIKINESLVFIESLKQFLTDFGEKYTNILKIKGKGEKSQTILYPIDFILSDDLHGILNPDYDKETRSKEKKIFYESLDGVKISTYDKSYKAGNIGELHFDKGFELLKDLLISISENQKDLNVNPNLSRLDIRRQNIYVGDFKKLFSDNDSIREKARSEAIEVNVDGFKGCYLSDLSIKGSSFVLPVDKLNLKEDSTIDVEYTLDIKSLDGKSIRESINIKTTFWITRIERTDSYMKASGFYLDNKVESDLMRYLNYLDTKKRV